MCVCVCVCVNPSQRLLIISSMIWTPYDWLNKFYRFGMVAVVGIINVCGLGIVIYRGSSKVGVAYVNMCVSRSLKEEELV